MSSAPFWEMIWYHTTFTTALENDFQGLICTVDYAKDLQKYQDTLDIELQANRIIHLVSLLLNSQQMPAWV